MGEDFRIAISYIKGDYAKEKKLLWDLYRTETRYGIFNEEHLRNSYVDYVEEMKRLEQDEEGKYACDIEDFINYQLIDDAVEKGRLSLVPGCHDRAGYSWYPLSDCQSAFRHLIQVQQRRLRTVSDL